jgi:hypothetical protein
VKRSLIIVILCAGLPIITFAARIPHSSSKRPSPARPHRPEKPERLAKPNVADTVDRLTRMPVQDRERALAGLPPGQQKEISKRIDEIDRIDPANREQLLKRYRKFDTLTPQEKDEFRGVLRQIQKLPEHRHEAVTEELDHLSKLSLQDRTRRINSEEFRNRFSPDERQILSNKSSALLGKM